MSLPKNWWLGQMRMEPRTSPNRAKPFSRILKRKNGNQGTILPTKFKAQALKSWGSLVIDDILKRELKQSSFLEFMPCSELVKSSLGMCHNTFVRFRSDRCCD